MKYKVLWIDDDFKKQQDFIGEAEQDDIDIIPFESHEEGIDYLNNHLEEIHAVILDAKVKNKKGDTVTGLSGLTASRDRLIEINKNGYLPYFIFTGQPDYLSNEMFTQAFGKHYIKAQDNELLFVDLKESIENKVEYQIQRKYDNVFDVCTDNYVGKFAAKDLIEILKHLEYPANIFNDEKYFNCLRKIIEYVFRASNELGLLHDKCMPKDTVNLEWSRRFMSGEDTIIKPSDEKISCSKKHFPSVLSNNIKSIIDICGAASHTDGEKENGKVHLSEYKKNITSNYLLYALTFEVMDLLLWFKRYADENPDKEKNKLFWKTIEPINKNSDWIKGKVTRIADNGYATFKPENGNSTLSIIPVMVQESGLIESAFIEVRTELNGSKQLIREIRKLN